MDNKKIFSKNLSHFMEVNGKTRRDVCEALGFNYNTYTDWVKGKKYPRMDKVEMLANYFGILKSDLIEEKTEEVLNMQKENDAISDVVLRMKSDKDFFEAVMALHGMDPAKLSSLLALLK